MHLAASQLLKKKAHVAFFFFCLQLYTHRNITVGFNTIEWDSLITMSNYLQFRKNICQVKYAVFRDLPLYVPRSDYQFTLKIIVGRVGKK